MPSTATGSGCGTQARTATSWPVRESDKSTSSAACDTPVACPSVRVDSAILEFSEVIGPSGARDQAAEEFVMFRDPVVDGKTLNVGAQAHPLFELRFEERE
jgi:hypothetical protein